MFSFKTLSMLKKIPSGYAIIFITILLTAGQGCKKSTTPPGVPPPVVPPPVVVRVLTPLTKKISDQTNLINTLQSDTLIQISKGLSQTVITYLNTSSQPMKVFILEVDLNNPTLRLKAGTPNNSTAFARQTMSDIARTQDTAGNRVLAAVNGDYFNLTTGVPSSAIYKNGIPIKSQYCTLCTFLSIDDQNRAAIVSKDRTVDTTKIRQAIGGFHYLIKNSQKVTQGDVSIEPRTTVGVTAANVVYFILVDGRSASYSNGISFSQLSDMFFALGVKDAINMDGGGSTTLVVKEGASWAVKNRPSDNGTQRAVANGWTIVSTQ